MSPLEPTPATLSLSAAAPHPAFGHLLPEGEEFLRELPAGCKAHIVHAEDEVDSNGL